ncbi:MAG: ATP-binding cassette domain-containing protein [Anaerolineae bacterium]
MGQPTGTELAIRTEGLSKRYRDVLALDDLNLRVARGSVFGFLGRNGAGKTTTMRLLAGLAHPTAGRAWIMDTETTNGDTSSRRVFGYLPQNPTFYTWMTPRELLDYVGRAYGMEPTIRTRRIDEMLALVGLEEAGKRRIGGFSGGMIQRLGIAQALLHEPAVLLLDEPTSSLDPAGRHEVLSMLAGLRGSVTVFFSTHIIADVDRICDTIGVLHRGRLLQVTSREDLLAQHAVNAVALTVAEAGQQGIQRLLATLRAQPWVAQATWHRPELSITVTDVALAQRELLPILAAERVPIQRLEWVRPSLEEIFLEMSA